MTPKQEKKYEGKRGVLNARWSVESDEKWREIIDTFPWVEFPAGWRVQVIPPFAGATARFRVKLPGSEDAISIYADHYNALGWYGSPYWEVYPYHGDVGRCDLADTARLLEMIADRRESED